ETNWRSGHNELDIIGIDKKILVFFEVKVRKVGGAEDIIDAVDKNQFHRLAKAASEYMQDYDHVGEVRFDLIGITYFDKKNYKTRHIRDIFFPA
ncbi:MAG: endonuclease, partial [Saprospirales bacterium]